MAGSGGLRRYAALSAGYFAAIGLFSPYAPLWFQSLGVSTLAIGAIVSLQSATRLVAPYAWSWWGDHHGGRVGLIRLAAAGALLSALALLPLPWLVPVLVPAALAVAVVTTLLFLANSGVVPLYEALLSRALSTEQGIDPARYGRVRLWGSVGFLAAVLAFGAVLETTGIAWFPAFVALMNGALLLMALRLPRMHDSAAHAEPAPPVMPRLREPEVAWFFASIFCTVLAHTSLYAFYSLYLAQLGYGKTAIGALWALAVAAEILFFWRQGGWFGHWSPHRWLEIVAAVTVLRFAAIAAGGSVPAVLVAAQVLHAVSFAAHHMACIALVHRLFPDRQRGRGQALYTTLGYGMPGVLGGLAGGWLVTQHGYAAVFWAAAVAGALALACARRSAVAGLLARRGGPGAEQR